MGADLTLVTGPSRGAKSRWAEHLAQQHGSTVLYVATGPALPDDDDWQHRLGLHRTRRPAAWVTHEVGGQLPEFLLSAPKRNLLLIDSLGSWLAHHLELNHEEWELRQEAMLKAVGACRAPIVLVAEECGWGVVPATAVGGRFRDRLGLLEQLLMARAAAAWLVLHGRAIDLLSCSVPVPEG
ncbi:MAG: bifunctional adenosylcobinamide kinase/adenosylcobinamide-phosphate guanylyltransferase [Prochlorococcaceae cyanobacterium]